MHATTLVLTYVIFVCLVLTSQTLNKLILIVTNPDTIRINDGLTWLYPMTVYAISLRSQDLHILD